MLAPVHKYDHLSENLTTDTSIFIFSPLSTVFKELQKFQLNQVRSFEIIALDSRASKKIDLYSNCAESKLQALTFAAINLIYICLQ